MIRSNPVSLDRQLDTARVEADQIADAAVADLSESELSRCWTNLQGWTGNSDPPPANLPSSLRNFLSSSADLPHWVDQDRLRIAERVYHRYPADLLASLLYASLPECYAASDGASALIQTNRMVGSPGARLVTTAKFVVDVMSRDSLAPGGTGIRSAQKVRWMHAVVRRRIAESEGWEPSKGIPINQEHLVGTLVAFSQVSVDALTRLGVGIDTIEQDAYLHKWEVVGHLLGIKSELLPGTVPEARSLTNVIRQRNHRRSEAGLQLMTELMTFARSRFPPPVSGIPGALVHYLAPSVADILGVPPATNSRHWIALLRGAFLLRRRANAMLPGTRVLDLYNRLLFVRSVLWIETHLHRRSLSST